MLKAKWAVVGAGPAGIASIGYLLDQGIDAQSIVWIDPAFSGGAISMLWSEVPSNTKVGLFHQFFKQCPSFEIERSPTFELFQLPAEETCQLKNIIEPLSWVTKHLAQKVKTIHAQCLSLETSNAHWQLNLDNHSSICAEKVILAIGAETKDALYAQPQVIDLTQALNPTKLNALVSAQDSVAVFGSSHSAILVIKNLLEAGAGTVINFYRQPLRYAVYHQDWILYDNTGLKGTAAIWAKENIENQCIDNLHRIQATPENIQTYLPKANKAVYAIGFKRKPFSVNQCIINDYNKQTGVIDNNLYGVGIAFPEQVIDRAGNQEFNVGLWKFMRFLDKNIKTWIAQ